MMPQAQRQASDLPRRPLVSIFMFVRNGATSVRRALDSMLALSYPNIEFIVQEGVSTDGTLDILRQYGDRLNLNIVSEPDSGPNEGLWRALNRCSGEFIGSCLADEELIPDAITRALDVLLNEPDVGAVTGDAIITDAQGNRMGSWTSGPFSLVDYLLCDYTPYFCSSFFRRQSLLDSGLKSGKWSEDCVEFELWCRLATHSRIKYMPGVNAKYASHAGQSSNKARDVLVHFAGRLRMIATLCSDAGLVGDAPVLRGAFIWGHTRAFINHAIAFNNPANAEALYDVARRTMDQFGPVAGLSAMPPATKPFWSSLFGRRNSATGTSAIAAKLPPPPDPILKTRLYAHLAARYEDHGRLQEAIDSWRWTAETAGIIAAPPRDKSYKEG